MFRYDHSFLDIISPLWCLTLIIPLYNRQFKNDKNKPYFKANLYYHLFFSLIFTVMYLQFLGGGDSLSYHKTITTINKLMFYDFGLYWDQIINGNDVYHFNYLTGMPPGWIYRESESFFLCSVLSPLSLIGFNSIYSTSLLMGFLSSIASWKLYSYVDSMYEIKSKLLHYGLLFIPSLSFWCSGLSKDTLVNISVLLLITCVFKYFQTKKQRLKTILVLSLHSFLLANTRPFILYAIIIPLVLVLLLNMIEKSSRKRSIKRFYKVFLTLFLLGISFLTIDLNQSEGDFLESNTYLNEASQTQKDFSTNPIYGDKKYSLGEIEFTPLGLLKAMPLTILYGIYAPFIWQALSLNLIFNGIESVILLFLSFRFLLQSPRKKFKAIFSDSFLIFCLIFIIIISFITGLTSILFGVLVRLRAPLLPFLVLLLLLPEKKAITTKKAN